MKFTSKKKISRPVNFIRGIMNSFFGERGGSNGTYDNARPDCADPESSFRYADHIDDYHDPGVRHRLSARGKYETENNAILKGMTKTYSQDIVGRGPGIQTVGTKLYPLSTDFGEEIETKFSNWMKEARLMKSVREMYEAIGPVGESLGFFYPILIRDSQNRFKDPVKFNFRTVDVRRLDGPHGTTVSQGDGYFQGVKFDQYGLPLKYRIYKDINTYRDQGDLRRQGEREPEFNTIDASFVVHLFNKDYAEQARGVPAFSPILDVAYISRQIIASVSKAMRNGARLFAFLKTNLPPIVSESEIDGETCEVEHRCDPGQTLDFGDDEITCLPDGYDVEFSEPKHPHSNIADFMRMLNTWQSRPLVMPLGVGSGDSSGYNYSSARIDRQQWERQIDIQREILEHDILDKAFSLWWSQAIQLHETVGFFSTESATSEIGEIENRFGENPPPPNHKWCYQPFGFINVLQESRAQTERLRNGTSSLVKEHRAAGTDVRQEMQCAADQLYPPEMPATERLARYQKRIRNYLFGNEDGGESDRSRSGTGGQGPTGQGLVNQGPKNTEDFLDEVLTELEARGAI